MANASVVIYNAAREPVADLNQAFDVGYEQRINELYRAWFSLPYDDPHISECTGLRYAEIYNGDERVDLFRIIKKAKRGTSEKTYYRFECEHVFATLMNDEVKVTLNSGPGSITSIGDVLALQGTVNWALGSSDFDRQFLYTWEPGTSLLEAMADIPARFGCSYQWTFDTSSYPWTVNLITPPATVSSYLDRGRNLLSVDEDEDYTQIVTRLYPYGNLAGADQLDITAIEPSGFAYVSNNVATYGLIERIWIDQRYSVAQNLYDAAVSLIAEYSVPRVKYSVAGADLYSLSGESIDEFVLGALVEVTYDDLDISVQARIVSITKSDVNGAPGDVQIQVANKAIEFDFRDAVQVNDLSALQMIDIPGGVVGALPTAPSAAGLYAATSYLGFSDGTNWRAYFDIDGKFKLVGDATHYLTFDPDAVTPLIIHSDGEWIGNVSISHLTAGDLAVQMNLTAGGSIKSQNYAAGTTGWEIDQDGSAEFQNATIRGSLNASDLDAGTLNFVTLGRSGLSVITSEITNLAITEGKLASGSVTNAKIGNLAVDTANIANLAVEEGKINSLAVTEGKIGSLAVTEGKIKNLAVTDAKIGLLAVTTAKINALAVTEAKIGALAVTEAKINNLAVTDAKINSLAVTKLTAGNLTVEMNLTAGGSVKSDNYAAGTAGWQIESDGDAEFNDVTVRGDIEMTTGSIEIVNGTETIWLNKTAGELRIGGTTYSSAPFQVSAAGALEATSGKIGGVDIDTASLTVGNAGIVVGDANNIVFFAGSSSPSLTSDFWVNTSGLLHCDQLDADGGTIGGFTIAGDDLYTDAKVDYDTIVGNGVHIGVDGIGLGDTFKVSRAGVLTCSDAVITGDLEMTTGSIELVNTGNTIWLNRTAGELRIGGTSYAAAPFQVSAAGALEATSGEIGGVTIGTDRLTVGSGGTTAGIISITDYAFYAGSATPADADFWVKTDGSMNCENIAASGGTVGGFTIATHLYTGSKTAYGDGLAGVHVGTDGIGLGAKFKVSAAGAVTCTDLTITGGTINVNSGAFAVTALGVMSCTGASIRGTLVADDITSGTLNVARISEDAITPYYASFFPTNSYLDMDNQAIYNCSTLRGGAGATTHYINMDTDIWYGASATSYLSLVASPYLRGQTDITINAGSDIYLKSGSEIWFTVNGGTTIAKCSAIVATDSVTLKVGHEGLMTFDVGGVTRYLAFREAA